MTLMGDTIAADTESVFISDFAESFVFKPKDSPARTIDAICEEESAARTYSDSHLTVSRRLVVFVKRSETLGIDTIGRGDVGVWQDAEWGNPEIVSGDQFTQAIRFHRKEIEASGRVRPGRL